MMTSVSLFALLPAIHLASGVVLAAAPDSSECVGETPSAQCAGTSKGKGADEDWFSLLQVSVTAPAPTPSKQDGLSGSPISHAEPTPRQDELKSKILEARASLAAMEAELAQSEESGSAHAQDSFAELAAEATVSSLLTPKVATPVSPPVTEGFGVTGNQFERNLAEKVKRDFTDMSSAVVSDGSVKKFIARRCPGKLRSTASSIGKDEVSLLQTKDATAGDASENENYPRREQISPRQTQQDMSEQEFTEPGMSWRGMSHFQVPTIESHVSGHRCQSLPSVHNVGGPAALPNILANTIVLYQEAGYEGYKLRDMVSNQLSSQLSNGGPWNVVSGIFDWNLYHEATKFCTVAVKFQVDDPDWYSDWIAFGA